MIIHRQFSSPRRLKSIHRYPKKHIPAGADNFLSVLEGIEGGFAIFTSIIVGLSFYVTDRNVLIVTALIGIIVNGFNSSAIRYISQHYVDELDGHEKRHIMRYYFIPAVTEFIMYLLVSGIVLLPLLLIGSLPVAIASCIVLTLGVLFIAGWYKGKTLHSNPRRDAMELAIVGALIIGIGASAGYLLS